MTYEICKKGNDDLRLIITPSDNLERSFFDQLFSGEVKFETVPNTDNIVISKVSKPN